MGKKTSRRATPTSDPPDANASPVETPPMARLHLWQIQAVRDLLFVAAIVGVVWIGYAMRAVTVPLLVALLLAYLFEPLIERLERHPRISRPGAVTGLLATVGVALALLLLITLPLVIRQTTDLVNDMRGGVLNERLARIEEYTQDKILAVRDLLDFRSDDGGEPAPIEVPPAVTEEVVAAPVDPDARTREIVNEEINRRLADMQARDAAPGLFPSWLSADRTGRVARGGMQAIVGALGAIVAAGLLAFLIPFYFFFFSVWYRDVLAFSRKLLPERNRKRALELLEKMDLVVAGFVRGRIVISLIMGVMLAVGWFICGVPYAILLGLVVGVFCAVPYLGTIGVPVAVGLLLVDQLGLPAGIRMPWWSILLWPTVVFAIVQLIEGYILTPKIAGQVTNLDPVTILVVVLAGGSVLGVYGMLLAIPIAACGKILFVEVLMPRIQAWTRGEVADPLPIGND